MTIDRHFVRKGCSATNKIPFLLQFSTIDPHFVRNLCSGTSKLQLYLSFCPSTLISSERVDISWLPASTDKEGDRETRERKRIERKRERERQREKGKFLLCNDYYYYYFEAEQVWKWAAVKMSKCGWERPWNKQSQKSSSIRVGSPKHGSTWIALEWLYDYC